MPSARQPLDGTLARPRPVGAPGNEGQAASPGPRVTSSKGCGRLESPAPGSPSASTSPAARSPARPLLVNSFSILGLLLAVVGGGLIVGMAAVGLGQGMVNPYTGLVGFLLSPIVLVIGLLLVP